jgi:hypothetical protein
MPEKPQKRVVITAEDIFVFAGSRDELLSPEKLAQLRKDLDNPNSHLVRFLQEVESKARDILENPSGIKRWQTVAKDGKRLSNRSGLPDPPEAYERQAIVNSVRKAAELHQLTKDAAEEVLAEAGETLTWVDSMPDRTLIEEPLVPFAGSPAFQRTQLARTSPVLAAVIAEENQRMLVKLTEYHPSLARELTMRLSTFHDKDTQGPKCL